MALLLERIKIVYHLAAEERAAVLQCRLVDNHLCTFGLNAFHHTLD